MKTAYIIGGIVVVGGAGAAVWYFTRKKAEPPPVQVGAAPNTFSQFCQPVAAAGLMAGGAAYGAPPTATVGVANAAAPGVCGVVSTVAKISAKALPAAARTNVRVAGAVATLGLSETSVGKKVVSSVGSAAKSAVKKVKFW